MSVGAARGKGEIGTRAGSGALSLLGVPFNSAALRALAEGPQLLTDLRHATGTPPPTTMRNYLRALASGGVVKRRRGREFAGTVSYELTPAGRGLIGVSTYLAAWLSRSPQGSIELSSGEARGAIKVLVEAWSAGVVRALAARPLSLTELDSVLAGISYPSLERRLSGMRLLGMVEAAPVQRRSTPYMVTEWLRAAVTPLAAAARWERRHRSQLASPITNRDIEAALLLALPLLHLPPEVSGSCRLAVRIGNGSCSDFVGVVAKAHSGAVVSSTRQLRGSPDSSVIGSAAAWFSAVVEQDASQLDLTGELRLATSLLDGLRNALFPRRPLQWSLIDRSM